MKKYLMTGVAALALCAGFVGCSKDDDVYDPNAVANLVQAQYDAAFIQTFGQPAADQDWGFGATSKARMMTRALGDYVAYKGSLKPTVISWATGQAVSTEYTFPSDCSSDKFLASVPDVNIMPADGEVRNGGSYIINSSTTKVNVNTNVATLYVDGVCNLSENACFEVKEGTEIYIVDGATLKLNAQDANHLKAIIYIAPTGKLETTGDLKMDNTSKVYNHGTIEAKSFEVNVTSLLYNVGTLKTTESVYVANNESVIVNDGTIISGSETSRTGRLDIHGSGRVQNNAEWTVYGNTFVSSTNNVWVNNGHFITDYFNYTAGSSSVINNCMLDVNNNFCMNTGDGNASFQMDGNAGVTVGNFYGGQFTSADCNGDISGAYGGPYRIIMGGNSVFKVTGTATLNAGNPNYGFYGPASGGYAVLEATHIVKGGDAGGKKVTYGGNLYVSATDHFASEIDPWNQVIVFGEGFEKSNIFTTSEEDEYSTGKPGINIAKTPCNPGFTGDINNSLKLRVFAEDLSARADETVAKIDENSPSDWDFNDVVFDAEYVDATHAKITLWAAGGTLPLRFNKDDNLEVHKLFNVDVKTMVNTHAKEVVEGAAGYGWKDNEPEKVFTITIDGSNGNFDDATYKDNFPLAVRDLIIIEVQKNNKWYELTAQKGKPACKIATSAEKVKWLKERKDIRIGYETFKQYVGYPSVEWWKPANEPVLYNIDGNSVKCKFCTNAGN